MSDFLGTPVTVPPLQFGRRVLSPRAGSEMLLGGSGGAQTNYCYRTTGGSRGHTTSYSSIPVGAEVERIVVQ